jgi:hypothetical protein
MVRLALAVACVLALVGAAAPAATSSSGGATGRDEYQYVPYEPMPASFDELPLGAGTSLPWWERDQLHVGSVTIDTELRVIASRGGTTVVGRGSGASGSRTEWRLVRGERLRRLPTAGSTRMPLVSANGRWIAWLDAHSTRVSAHLDRVRYRLAIYDAATRRVVVSYRETRRTEWEDYSNGLMLASLDNRGRALFERGTAGPHLLTRSGRSVPLDVRRLYTAGWDGWPRGVMLNRYGSMADYGVFGTVTGGGQFAEVGRIPFPSGSWSPSGGSYVLNTSGENGDAAFWVYRIDDGTVVQLGVPPVDGSIHSVGWESEEEVVLWWHDSYGPEPVSLLVRCDASTGDCERVFGGPKGRRATMPDR